MGYASLPILFKVNGVGRSQFPELDGKIIKLFIQCKQKSSVSSGCLLFKMKGSFNCEYLLEFFYVVSIFSKL